MIRLNRATEYGLIALRHMQQKKLRGDLSVTSAREISDTYQLPAEITAKTLQRLKDTGLIQSEQGARGGYLLGKVVDEASFGQFVEWLEGPQSLVGCQSEGHTTCEYLNKCEIKDVLLVLNRQIKAVLENMSLQEILNAAKPDVTKTLTPGLMAFAQDAATCTSAQVTTSPESKFESLQKEVKI